MTLQVQTILHHQDLDQERDYILAHLMTLSAEDLDLRFFKLMTQSQLIEWVNNLNKNQNCVCILFKEENRIIAFGQIFFMKNGMAEISLTIDPQFRNQGLAGSMFRHMIEGAKQLGITGLYLTCKACNRAIYQLAKKFGFSISFVEGDVYGTLEI